jgi:hypothetical protein
MYPLYSDIRSKLGTPKWHDQNGVPRYDDFHPSLLGVYDKFAALFLVECQSCYSVFPCAIGAPDLLFKDKEVLKIETIEDFIDNYVVWGDAPWHNDEYQCAGTTMSSDVTEILSAWRKDNFEWSQVEVKLKSTNL